MATRCQCIANRAFWRYRPIRVWSRSFTDANNYAEEPPPRKLSPRAQAQRESADAVQNLVRRRQGHSDTEMRSIPLKPISNENSEEIPFPTFSRKSDRPFQPRQIRRVGPRGTDSSVQNNRNAGSKGQRRPRTIRDGEIERRPSRRKEESEEIDFVPDLDSGGDAMTTEEHEALLKKLGHVKKETITTYPGPHLDMANLMIEYAPKHFGVTDPTSGQYPSLTDTRSRGLLQDVIKQVRKNETYTEKNIERLIKKLGPAMPRA